MRLRSFVCGAALLLGTVTSAVASDDDGGWVSADRPAGRDEGGHEWRDAHEPHDGHGRFAPADEDGHGPHGGRMMLHDDGSATRPYWGTTRPYWGPTQPAQPPRDWRDPQRAGSVQDVPVRRGKSHRGGHEER